MSAEIPKTIKKNNLGGSITSVVSILLRHDELAVVVIIVVHLYVDWYLGLHLIAPLLALGLLLTFFFARSPNHPWIQPPALWLWVLFLVITIYPAIRGGILMRYDAASYYPSNILGAIEMYWLGIVVAQNVSSMQRFFKMFAAFGALLAIHTIIQATTGIVLFGSAHWAAYLADPAVSGYQLAGSNFQRAGSFFIDPNWNGTFYAIMFFLPLGLFFKSSSRLAKALYLAEMCLILPALLLTYSNGAWISVIGGIIAFLLLLGTMHRRIIFALTIFAAGIMLTVLFPTQIALQFHHLMGNQELSLRIAAWQTALRVIYAYPLTGVGLGLQAYLTRSNPFRVPEQFIPLSHPHNSYLEWAAMGGLPVLIVFLALLTFTLWLAWRNWLRADVFIRPLLGGGIAAVIALSVNSISINGWTHFVLSMMGWLILGIISSPLLMRSQQSQSVNEEKTGESLVHTEQNEG